MKAVKLILIAIGLLLGLFLILGLFAPNTQSVSQSTIIKAPASAIFNHIKFMDKMAKWHPFLKKDPNILISVDGQDGQSGAVRYWKSKVDIAGEGKDEITAMVNNVSMTSKVDIESPRASQGESTFILEELSEGTKVTWSFDYNVPYPFNTFLLFEGKEGGLTPYFAEGLLGLKNTLERFERTEVKYSLSPYTFDGGTYIFKRQAIPMAEMDNFISSAYQDLSKLRTVAGLKSAGSPMGMIFAWDDEDDIDFALGLPVLSGEGVPGPFIMTLPPVEDCQATYVNDMFSNKKKAHKAIQKQLSKNGETFKYPILEEYRKSPLFGNSNEKSSVRLIYSPGE